MIKNRARSAVKSVVRPAIGSVHALTGVAWVLVLGTGLLSPLSFLLWTAMCAAVDQAFVWSIWAAGDRKGTGPNRGWF